MLREVAYVDVWDRPVPPPQARAAAAGGWGGDGLLALPTDRVDDELLDAAGPGLRVVANLAVGRDNIDLAACARRGIPVATRPAS
ncbi:MAG: hypothetical protein R3C32_08050 [Chloroflexota bacterium]